MGHLIVAILFFTWIITDTGPEVPIAIEIVAAAIVAGILFEPTITAMRIAKRYFRTQWNLADDTDALWEPDWATSKYRRASSNAASKRRRWQGACIGALLPVVLFGTLLLSLASRSLDDDVAFAEFQQRIAEDSDTQILMLVLMVVAIGVLSITMGIVGHQVEKSLRPRPSENPMRRDNW